MKIYKIAIKNNYLYKLENLDRDLPFAKLFNGHMRFVIPIFSNFMNEVIEMLTDGKTASGIKYKVDTDKRVAYKVSIDGEIDPRALRLGKVIQRELGQEWSDKWSHEVKSLSGEGKSIVLSRSPIDIIRMSDHGGWHSCHSPGESYFESATDEAIDGGAIAYVVENAHLESFIKNGGNIDDEEIFKDKDRNIRGLEPLSRMRVNLYINEKNNEELALPVDSNYGAEISGFSESLTKWLYEKQKEYIDYNSIDMKEYVRYGGAYADQSDREIIKHFFGNDKGVKGDLPHKGQGNRLKIWEEELEKIKTDYNKLLKHSEVGFHIDNDDHIYISGFAEISFSLNGLVSEDTATNEDFLTYLKGLNFAEYTEYNDDISVARIEVRNGFSEIKIDLRMPYIDMPDDFRNKCSDIETYERNGYKEDIYSLMDWLTNNGLIERDGHYDLNYLEGFSNHQYGNLVYKFLFPFELIGGREYRFPEELAAWTKTVFENLVNKKVTTILERDREQSSFDFYKKEYVYWLAVNGVKCNVDVTRHYAGGTGFMGQSAIEIEIDGTELYRLGKNYFDVMNRLKDEINAEMYNLISEHLMRNRASKDNGSASPPVNTTRNLYDGMEKQKKTEREMVGSNWYKWYKGATKPPLKPPHWTKALGEADDMIERMLYEGLSMIDRMIAPFINEFAMARLYGPEYEERAIVTRIAYKIAGELAIRYDLNIDRVRNEIMIDLRNAVERAIKLAAPNVSIYDIEIEKNIKEIKGIFRLANMKIMPFDEEGDNEELEDDHYVVMDQVENAFHKSEIRPDRNKKLTKVITIDGVVVGGIYSSLEQEDEGYRYSFDIAIHPAWRGKGGYRTIFRLIEEGLKEWKYYQSELGNVYCWVWAVNPQIANILEQKYGFEREDMGGQSILTRYAQTNNQTNMQLNDPYGVFEDDLQALMEAIMDIVLSEIKNEEIRLYAEAMKNGNMKEMARLARGILIRVGTEIRGLKEYKKPWNWHPNEFGKSKIGDYLDEDDVVDNIMDMLSQYASLNQNLNLPPPSVVSVDDAVSKMKQLFNI